MKLIVKMLKTDIEGQLVYNYVKYQYVKVIQSPCMWHLFNLKNIHCTCQVSRILLHTHHYVPWFIYRYLKASLELYNKMQA